LPKSSAVAVRFNLMGILVKNCIIRTNRFIAFNRGLLKFYLSKKVKQGDGSPV